MSHFQWGIKAVERGWVPDRITRLAIQRLCRTRVQQARAAIQSGDEEFAEFARSLTDGPIAVMTDRANDQHYEIPAEFYELVLGPRRKYSCGYWENGSDLSQSETRSLELSVEHADLKDGHSVLELGCGWGSLTLFMAERFPASQIVAVSNSSSQRQYIERQAANRGLTNINVVTCDMNDFDAARHAGRCDFDRVVSIEMFEHMRNYRELLRRIASWMNPDGRLFVHIFNHRELIYPFDTEGDANWMGRYFFTGGMMPDRGIFSRFADSFSVANQWDWAGTHYQKTAEAWLVNLDRNRSQVLKLFREVYGSDQSHVWFHRWRMFFLAVAELFGAENGQEWGVSHYLLAPVAR